MNEFDVSRIAWKTYEVMYNSNFDEFEIIDAKRAYISAIYSVNRKKSKGTMVYSGDIDFNFTKGFAHSRLECFDKLLENGNNEKNQKWFDLYKNNLEIFRNLTYSILNISLIGKNGNLQSVKQSLGNDRIDTFIWALNEYYNKRTNLVMNYSSYNNLIELKKYLDMFDDIYEYCETVYHIDDSLVNDIIHSGKLPIDKPERVIEFMNLAIRFWGQKLSFLKKQWISEELITELNKVEKEFKRITYIM